MEGPKFGMISTLCEICHKITSTLHKQEALDLIVKSATEFLELKASSIRLLDSSGRTLEVVASYGLSDNYLMKGPVDVDKNPADAEVLRGKLCYSHDITSEDSAQYKKEAAAEGLTSVLNIPLMVNNQAIGILRAYSDGFREFTGEEKFALQALAHQGAIAIQNARKHEEMKTLFEISRNLSSSIDIHERLHLVVKSVTEALGVKAASIGFFNEEKHTIEMAASYGLSKEYITKGPIHVEKGLVGRQILQDKNVYVFNLGEEPKFEYRDDAKAEGLVSFIAIPMKVKEKIFGVLRLYTERPYHFSTEETEFLQTVANLGATAIENARLFQVAKDSFDDMMQDLYKWYDYGFGQH